MDEQLLAEAALRVDAYYRGEQGDATQIYDGPAAFTKDVLALVSAAAGPVVVPPPDGRSPRWPSIRARHLLKENKCRACGGVRRLNVHHIKPFYLFPEEEENPDNLITLCEGSHGINCHLVFGHAGNWKSYNESVKTTADYMSLIFKERKGLEWPLSGFVGLFS